jgi:arylsulfatase A-like enzyme
MLYGSDIREGVQLDPAQIYDVIPTALYLLGLPIPADWDGQVLKKAINAALLDRRPVERRAPTSPVAEATSSRQTFSEAEEQIVAQRLRDLGYL